MTWTVWQLRTTLDRCVAWPGEQVHVSFTILNPLSAPIFIASYAWNASFYSIDQAVASQVNCVIPAGGFHLIGDGTIQVPDVSDGSYEINVVLETFVYDASSRQWIAIGPVNLSQPQTIQVAHIPRYRAFVSRSNRLEDRPLGDLIVSAIQQRGFDTHTVGINEIEQNPSQVPQRIIEEILKADCLFAIATPRDISAITNLVKTLAWLQSEVTIAYLVQKPLLMLVDQTVCLEGLLASPDMATLPYEISKLDELVSTLHRALPVVRQVIAEHQQVQLVSRLEHERQIVAYGAFIAGKAQGSAPAS